MWHSHWIFTHLLKKLRTSKEKYDRNAEWITKKIYHGFWYCYIKTEMLFLYLGTRLMISIVLISDPSFKWENVCVFFLPLVVQCELEKGSILKVCLAGARVSPWMVVVVSEPLKWSNMETDQASFTTLVCVYGNIGEILWNLLGHVVSDTRNRKTAEGKLTLLKISDGSEEKY